MNIIVQTTGGYASSLNSKIESPNNTLANITRALLLNQVTRNNFGVFNISMPYGSPEELIIDCVVMLLTSYCMEQDLPTNISKYGV